MQEAAIDSVNATWPSARPGWRVVLELGVGYGLILWVIWASRPWQRYLYWVAVAWILLVTVLSFDGWREMGLRVDGFGRSLWVVGVAAVVAAIVVAVGSTEGTLHPPHGGAGRFVATFWGYCIWAFFQQFLLQAFVLLRLMRLLPVRQAVVAAAALFALAHLPNPILTPLTVVWGLAACVLFLRYRNLYTLAVAHAILGVTLSITVPAARIHNMRVGWGYVTYRPHGVHRLPSLAQP
ncbi:MAG TPA: CPBP family glutamic-type intramembrane protease [Edaphobacter sp.]